jgi:hypothetical protein
MISGYSVFTVMTSGSPDEDTGEATAGVETGTGDDEREMGGSDIQYSDESSGRSSTGRNAVIR